MNWFKYIEVNMSNYIDLGRVFKLFVGMTMIIANSFHFYANLKKDKLNSKSKYLLWISLIELSFTIVLGGIVICISYYPQLELNAGSLNLTDFMMLLLLIYPFLMYYIRKLRLKMRVNNVL